MYIHRLNESKNNYLLSNLHKECIKSSKLTSASTNNSTSLSRSHFSYSANRQQQQQQQNNTFELYDYESQLFANFLYQHVSIAFKEGFNDNIGRTNIAPIFELPKLSNWIRIYENLYEALFNIKTTIASNLPIVQTSASTPAANEQKLTSIKTKMLQNISQIKPYADIDVKFSMNRCKKSLPSALNVYQEGLPQHYTRKQHSLRLEKARHIYCLSARGPMFKKYLQQLEADCLNIWKQGRQSCEAISLTGNSCINDMHRVCIEDDDDLLPIKNHNSNVITIATSNCGYFQKDRTDPFNLKDANFTFYQSFNSDETMAATMSRSNKAKKILNKFDFPIFKPTTASVSSSAARNINLEENQKLMKNSNENLSVNNLSQEDSTNNNNNNNGDQMNTNNNNDSILSDLFSNKLILNDTKDKQQQQQPQHNSPANNDELFSTALVSENNPAATSTATIYQLDTQLSSKTVYLEGMTHSDCQPGLLPLFSSWSLCSIGKYSDYSVHNGLTQPGFLNGNNYLLPWEYLSNSLNKKSGKGMFVFVDS